MTYDTSSGYWGRLRRQRVTRCTNEAVSDYVSCSLVLQQLTWSVAHFPAWKAPVEEP